MTIWKLVKIIALAGVVTTVVCSVYWFFTFSHAIRHYYGGLGGGLWIVLIIVLAMVGMCVDSFRELRSNRKKE